MRRSAGDTVTTRTAPSRRLRLVQGQPAARTCQTASAGALSEDVDAHQQAVISHLPVPPARHKHE
jgi:hypothetical protein